MTRDQIKAAKVLDLLASYAEPVDELDDIGPDEEFMQTHLAKLDMTTEEFAAHVESHRKAVAAGDQETIKKVLGIAEQVVGSFIKLAL